MDDFAPAARSDSQPDPARMHRYARDTENVADQLLHYSLERVRLDVPLDAPRTKAELDLLGSTVTPSGLGSETALAVFADHLAPATISQDHPRNWAFVPCAPTETAVLFDLVVGASSIYGGSWMEGAGAVWAENQALRWLADLAGFPSTAGGVFVSGGSAANLSALVAARHRARRDLDLGDSDRREPRWIVACGPGAHSSIDAAARVMDIDVLRVDTHDDTHMRADDLAAAFDRLQAEACSIGTPSRGAVAAERAVFAVVATAGTTNAGAIDGLAGIAALCEKHGLWLHVDGAYGGAALCVPSVRASFDGIERADSFVVDPHKWLFAPYDCAALLYSDPGIARDAFRQRAGYLDVLHDDDDEWNPSDYAFHLTRRARGLPFWFSLASHGTDAYRDAVAASIVLAHDVARLIDADPELELLAEPELSVVLFRRRGWGAPQHQEWSDRMLRLQQAFVVPTTAPRRDATPESVLRLCFTNPRTTLLDVSEVLSTLR